MNGSTIWLLALLGVAAGLYLWYATLVSRRNKVGEALSSVDVHLTQRHDLIPNIVKLAARFMEHERELITEVTRLRGQAQAAQGNTAAEVSDRFKAEAALATKTGQLMLSMEAYPQLKSDATVLQAQRSWTETEAQITAARRFYNAAVNQLNSAIQIFPGSVLAALAGVTAMPFFEASAEARIALDLDAILQRKSPVA